MQNTHIKGLSMIQRHVESQNTPKFG